MAKINQIKKLCENPNFKGKKLLKEIDKIINLENREEEVEIVPLESILEGSIDEVLASLDSLSNDEDINPKTFVLKQRKRWLLNFNHLFCCLIFLKDYLHTFNNEFKWKFYLTYFQ